MSEDMNNSSFSSPSEGLRQRRELVLTRAHVIVFGAMGFIATVVLVVVLLFALGDDEKDYKVEVSKFADALVPSLAQYWWDVKPFRDYVTGNLLAVQSKRKKSFSREMYEKYGAMTTYNGLVEIGDIQESILGSRVMVRATALASFEKEYALITLTFLKQDERWLLDGIRFVRIDRGQYEEMWRKRQELFRSGG